jgi:uncharacterized SAM-binding protein YcdF (DUF218 family)
MLESRHRTGVASLIFLIIATILAWLAYKNIWATAKRERRIAGPLDPENIAKSNDASVTLGLQARGHCWSEVTRNPPAGSLRFARNDGEVQWPRTMTISRR